MLKNQQIAFNPVAAPVFWWLLLCAIVIYGMILLGGVTRLTDSGLSMVDWKPIMGVIPPLSQADWQEMFLKYQQYPEYKKTNFQMTLSEFKPIFMYEYLHRVLGRIIGLIFFVPLIIFSVRKQIPSALMPRLYGLFILGGLQGLLGWYMVKSGLVDDPNVSQYRLTSHLGMAILIYSIIIWTLFDLGTDHKHIVSPGIKRTSLLLSALIFLMILSGGLVAGTRAGIPFPTWPLMGETFIPKEIYTLNPIWLSAFEDMATIQFNHRIFAYVLTVLITGFVVTILRSNVPQFMKYSAMLFLAILILQVVLGISTLLLYIPIPVAAGHQIVAVALLSISLFLSHCCLHRRKLVMTPVAYGETKSHL